MTKKIVHSNHLEGGLLLLTLLLAAMASAGDLNPPAPPTSGTMKTLDQVEPRKPIPASAAPTTVFAITQSGSYYLTGDRKCSETGIEVIADDVTLDLCGYTLTGPSVADSSGVSILMHKNVQVRNGTIRGFTRGIFASGACQNLQAIELRAMSNRALGIYFAGTNHVVKDCTVSGNGYNSPTAWPYGIYVGRNSLVSGNTVEHTGDNMTVSGGVPRIYAIRADGGSTIMNNICSNNGSNCVVGTQYLYVYGISVTDSCVVTGNTASYNGVGSNGSCQSYGIETGSGCKVSGNTASHNGSSVPNGTGSENARAYGINAASGSVVTDNAAFYNGSSNTTYLFIYGILTGEGCTVRGNTASYNGEYSSAAVISGIETGGGCTIVANTAYQNGSNAVGTGIRPAGACLLDQNTCIGNFAQNMANQGVCLVTSANLAP